MVGEACAETGSLGRTTSKYSRSACDSTHASGQGTFTLCASFDGIGAFKYPDGRFSGGSGGLDMLNRPWKASALLDGVD